MELLSISILKTQDLTKPKVYYKSPNFKPKFFCETDPISLVVPCELKEMTLTLRLKGQLHTYNNISNVSQVWTIVDIGAKKGHLRFLLKANDNL